MISEHPRPREQPDHYYLRRAAEERARAEKSTGDLARQAHLTIAAAYERQAFRALLDNVLG
jgi:hypothetical protein